jgi:transposase
MGTQITGGVDTHLDVHVAAALDDHGGLLGTASFATTPDGYRELAGWLASFGEVVVVGVEGTGSYGAGLTRHLHAQGVRVVEVDRPNRQRRRRAGKSDTHDAVSAARAAFAGDALGAPKTRDGNVEAIRVLRIARTSARRDRTRALNQMRSLVTTAPDELRSQLRKPDHSETGSHRGWFPPRGTNRCRRRESSRAQGSTTDRRSRSNQSVSERQDASG